VSANKYCLGSLKSIYILISSCFSLASPPKFISCFGVAEVPEMPKNIRVSDQQSRSLQMSWTQPYAGNNAITNYVIQYKLVSGMCGSNRTHHARQLSWDQVVI
jgi:hypothetical protein